MRRNIRIHPYIIPMNKYTPKAWLIDPVTQKVSLQEYEQVKPMIPQLVGPDAEAYKLDFYDNILWASDIPTNGRFAFFCERMFGPFSERRYNRGLIICLGATVPPWDPETLKHYIRVYDRQADKNISYQIIYEN